MIQKEINAELWLNRMYPDLRDKWVVRSMGTFYRNYNSDIMETQLDTNEVSLARDSFLHLLPDSIIADADELREGDFQSRYEVLKQRELLLRDAFAPLDTFHFRHFLHIEQKVSTLLADKLDYILKQHFDIDLSQIDNPYVRKVAQALPFITQKRGDLQYVRQLLAHLFECEVELDQSHRYSQTDSTLAWLPEARFNILLTDLTHEEYVEQTRLLASLTRFLEEWLLPFDLKTRISLRQHGLHVSTNNKQLILDYNTEL